MPIQKMFPGFYNILGGLKKNVKSGFTVVMNKQKILLFKLTDGSDIAFIKLQVALTFPNNNIIQQLLF
jgi:hypothetical protein